jgi:hypothetical protein
MNSLISHDSQIRRTIGSLSPQTLDEIDEILKRGFVFIEIDARTYAS